ncbi:MAG: transcriptional repressor [Bacteroidia bacterium]|nr:MAG: transcriptional repressor [Bacteroidia bacterium]
MQTANDILKKYKMSITASRLKILDAFLQTNGALAHADIEEILKNEFDRVTIYRTLQFFVEKGILHDIPVKNSATQYALCKDDCGQDGHHHDHHIHFLCNQCKTTFCLDNTHIPKMNIPSDYVIQQIEVIVNGICQQCNKS